MKMKNLASKVLLIFTTLYLTSCTTSGFYQICKISPSVKDNVIINKDSFFFEDNNCKVIYDFWSEGGNAGFKFYNKTDKDIILDLEKSFFILNGIAYNYFRSRTFASAESLVTFSEEKKVYIPPYAAKIITEYNITSQLYRDCDLYKYPRKKQIITKYFKDNKSPYIFSNRISYSVNSTTSQTTIENEFYVSEITNYPANEVLKAVNLEICGQKSNTVSFAIKEAASTKFYLKYDNAQDKWKH